MGAKLKMAMRLRTNMLDGRKLAAMFFSEFRSKEQVVVMFVVQLSLKFHLVKRGMESDYINATYLRNTVEPL